MSEVNQAADAAESTSSPEESANEVLQSIDEGSEEVTEAQDESSEESDESIDTTEATDEELEEVMDSDEATDAEKAEAKQELVKRLKLKVNGREIEEEIDFNDEDKLREILQKGYAADERFQQASSIEKRMKEYAELIQKDPIEALIAAGHDPDAIAEAHMKKRIEDMQKSPEQKRLEELERELEKERSEREKIENERQEAEQMRIQHEYERQLDDEITEALGVSDLPKSPYVVKRIAENLMLAIDNGYEDVTVQDILPLVDRQIKDEIRQMFEAMPEEVIEKTLGNNVSEKLRKRRVARVKKAPESPKNIKATGQTELKKAQAQKEAKPKQAKDFWKDFGSR